MCPGGMGPQIERRMFEPASSLLKNCPKYSEKFTKMPAGFHSVFDYNSKKLKTA